MAEGLTPEIYDFINDCVPINLFCDMIEQLSGGNNELALQAVKIDEEIKEENDFLDDLPADGEEENVIEFGTGAIELSFNGITVTIYRFAVFVFLDDDDGWVLNEMEYGAMIEIQCKYCSSMLDCDNIDWYSSSARVNQCKICRKRNTWLLIGNRIAMDKHVSRHISKFV